MKFLHMIGNAHLDLAWIWPWQEGFSEIKATFLSALTRLEEFDGFIFTSSSAQYYEWVEKNAPELFARITHYIQKGRWILCGGWWVQPDCNLPGGESFIRQGLYGQQYFYSRFGVTASVGYNVDSFGHNSSLPQILKKSGMDSYLFLRPNEQELELPNGAFLWEGNDGSLVTACRIPVNYSSIAGLKEQLQDALDRFPENSRHFICFYGVGNHGGGPTIANIQYLLEHIQITDDCKLLFSHPIAYFNAIAGEMKQLPKVSGELQHHAPGCYSVSRKIKQLNRLAEESLVTSEIWSSLAAFLPISGEFSCQIHKAWKNLLSCQFHDILAGVCIPSVCESAIHTLGGVCSAAEQALNHSLQAISFAVDIPYVENSQPLVVFNPHSFEVKAIVYHEKGSWHNYSFPEPCRVEKSDGTSVPFQFVHLAAQLDERKRIAFLAALPPLGYETFRITADNGNVQTPFIPKCPENILENELVRITLDSATGLISSYYDKCSETQLLAKPSGYFLAHPDDSDTWSHGEISFRKLGQAPALLSITRLEQGPLIQKIQALFRLGHSQIRQVYTLRQDVSFLEIETELNWQEEQTCLKLYFEFALEQAQSFWNSPFGAIKRPVTGLEEPFQTWVDLSGIAKNGQFCGMALAGFGSGGAHVQDSTLGMTLLRSPVYAHHAPHPLEEKHDIYSYTDQGLQQFHFLLLPHMGSWQESHIVQHAMVLNRPVIKTVETFHQGNLPQHFQGITISAENIVLSCLKPAIDENGTIIRLWESCGRAVNAAIQIPLLEQSFQAEFAPYEIKTFRLLKGHAPEECMMTEFAYENDTCLSAMQRM